MVSLRLVRPDDAAGARDIYAPFVTDSAVSFESAAPSVAEMRRRIESKTARYPWLVCVENDAVLGYAYAGQHRGRDAYRWSVDVSVYVAETARRGGVATGLYVALFEALRAQGYVNAYAGTALPNAASTGFHESMGFEPVGIYEQVGYKCGEWRDVKWWVKRLADRHPDPAEPVPIAEILGGQPWDDALAAGEGRIGV